MARGYLKAEVRCKQLERLVASHPGCSIPELVASLGMSYPSVCAYMVRLVREKRVRVELDDPALGAKSAQRFYPFEAPPVRMKRAA